MLIEPASNVSPLALITTRSKTPESVKLPALVEALDPALFVIVPACTQIFPVTFTNVTIPDCKSVAERVLFITNAVEKAVIAPFVDPAFAVTTPPTYPVVVVEPDPI
jgi:hypothetical protein